jgi:flagellar biosynthesis/type III secretory pathway chaperone
MTTDPIILALESQVSWYTKLAKLAEQQHICVQRGETDELLKVLQRRQEVLDQLAGLEKAIGPVKKQWSEYLATLQPDSRLKAEALLAETRRLLEQITTADRHDAIVLQQRKLNLGMQINKTTVARNVNKTYAAAAYGTKRPTVNIQQ